MATPIPRPLIATGVLAGLLALAGCADSNIYRNFTEPAGDFLDAGAFGNATMNNVQIHNGEKPFLVDLNARFVEEVPTTVTFAFNSARLDAEAQRILQRQAHWIRQFPEVRFRVYGHTDLVGSDAYNKRLGQRRAEAVVHYLGRLGISRARLEALVSFGEQRPAVFTQDRERRNRRTVTEVSGFVQTDPLVMNGKYAEIVFREYVASGAEEPPAGLSPLGPMMNGASGN